MLNGIKQFVTDLTNDLITKENYQAFDDSGYRLKAMREDNSVAMLDLRPFFAQAQPVTASHYFSHIKNIRDLIDAYYKARGGNPFEQDIPQAMANVSGYADIFLDGIIQDSMNTISDQQAQLIGRWVMNLDVYTAVKAVESLLNSVADLALLEIAQENHWVVHFDHLAIRCGSGAHGDAERVVELLKKSHGYVSMQIAEEAFYQFPDGWNAYPLYKILNNGQVLRIFVDQSDAADTTQIIQHWNKVYGYTAHHLAIRATKVIEGKRVAVLLDEMMDALKARGIDIMTPTGYYTDGLLLQVFTRPQRHVQVPVQIKEEITALDPALGKMIENAKLLELVSRKEMSAEFARRFFALYRLEYQADNPLHSAPIYQYFLPAQAAHVIKTSIQTA